MGIIKPSQLEAMIRYRLDDLGAYQFEKLVQSLFKARVSLAVESWGNRGDFGRDAYASESLNFPDVTTTTKGPFLFQAKFVEGANAAGAKPKAALMASVRSEIAEIKRRKNFSYRWTDPTHFTFITNSLIDSGTRDDVKAAFNAVLSSTRIITYGGDDVCDLLDREPTIYRSFPQLLSIRDLNILIDSALNKESIMRSLTAIEMARELVPVFTPTSNYERAWSVLRKHHFAVLEGPPEVGKSAIAWTIGLSQVGIGWEAIYCLSPNDFFKMYTPDKKQVFIADDAFGRTEYDPARTSAWEMQLDLVLHRLNPRHWLVWTSRKHILERAVARMDVTGKARSFPDPGAVIVDVQSLSIEERALVLFRHARAANLEGDCKTLVRENASSIIHDPDFTPERMRRFVEESLPQIISRRRSGLLQDDDLKIEIREAIRNPTKQMRVTFRSLEPALKWYLIALLELPAERWLRSGLPQLRPIYETYCPDAKRIPFNEITQQLEEAFIRIRPSLLNEDSKDVDWIHPSYRDLVIEELAADSELRTQFLRRASLEGVKIAVSDTGGAHGERQLPFMLSAESWHVLQERCLAIISEHDQDRALLEVLSSAATKSTSPDLKVRWEKLILAVCNAIRAKWNENSKILEAADIGAFGRARSIIKNKIEIPDITYTWDVLEENLRYSLGVYRKGDRSEPFDLDPFDDLTKFVAEISEIAPEFLQQRDFPDKYEFELSAIFDVAQSEIEASEYLDEADQLREKASSLSQFAKAVDRVSVLSSRFGVETNECSEKLAAHASALEDEAAKYDPPDPDNDDYRERTPSSDFDVHRLFAEL